MDNDRPIYFDFQATTPLDERALAAMLPYFTEKFGNPHASEHAFGAEAASAIASARRAIAELIGAQPGELIFTSGATEANNMLLRGAARLSAAAGRPGIVTLATEHKAVLDVMHELAGNGHPLKILPVDPNGLIDLDQFDAALDEMTGLASVMAVNNEIGTIQPIEAIGARCNQRGILFHCDAAQGAGKIGIDVRQAHIDLMSLSAHKLYGPKGIGAAYVRAAIARQFPPLLQGGGQERGLRPGTLPTPLCVGFGVACALAAEEMAGEAERLQKLRDRLLSALHTGGLAFDINGSLEARWPGNLNLSFAGVDAEALMIAVRPDLAVATGSACTTASLEPSHVVLALGQGLDRAEAAIRIGLGRYTTEAEVDKAAEILIGSVRRLTRVGRAALA
jgi:cysteine desulfurase